MDLAQVLVGRALTYTVGVVSVGRVVTALVAEGQAGAEGVGYRCGDSARYGGRGRPV